ncbi:MAG: NUDIX hydrolase [bacterium]|nr:NUDIX hydrolase [bacterium]
MKLPEKAEQVFKGVIFDVYQWEQEMYDGSTATFEGLKRQHTAEVIATMGDKIMIQDQEQPAKPRFLSLPGGRIEWGEDPLVGAKRELIEESGCTTDDWQLYDEVQPYTKVDWSIYVYIARNVECVQEMELDGGEKIEMKWVTFDELLDLVDEGKLYNIEQNLRMEFVRAKYHPPSKEALHKKIFGDN